MRIKEFAEKYNITYSIVYNSTWLIKQINDSWRYKEYDENDLKYAVMQLARTRVRNATRELNKYSDIINKLEDVTEN